MVKAITIIPRSGPADSTVAGPLNNISYDGITINFSDSKNTDNYVNDAIYDTIVDSQTPAYQTGNTYMIINSTWPGDSGGSNIKTLSLNGTDLTTRYIPILFVPGERAADYINTHWFGHANNVGTLADNFEELKLVDVSTGSDPVTFAPITIYGNTSSFDFLTGTVDKWSFGEAITSFINVDATNNYIAADKSGSFNVNVSNILWGKTYAIQIKPKDAVVGDTEKPVITSLTTGINRVENSGAGQTVYTIVATDNVGVTSYSIGGTDASLLTVNSSTGVVTLNANPNYETKSSYSFTAIATDAAGNNSDQKTVTFSISNANEPATGKPGITSNGNVSSPLVGNVLTATAGNIADPDGLGAFSYQWKRGGANISGATSSTYTIVSADIGSTITVSVSFTDGGGFASELLTSDPTGTVAAPNNPATGVPTITGTPALDQTLTATLGDMADIDGLSGPYTYQWMRNGTTNIGTNSTTYTVTSDDVGKTITVTVSFTDDGGNNESRTSDPVTVTALDDKIYFWTEYNDASNNTAIYYGIYNTTKISGVILNYDVSGSTTVPDVSYNEQDQVDNDTMIYKKEWPIHVINNRTDTSETNDTGVANKQMLFAGSMTQSINGMNMGVFAVVRGNIILTSIAAMVDHNSNFLTADKYAIGEPANPPEITDPGGRPLGDINYDGSLNDVDIEIMSAYLLNDTDSSFNVYDSSIDNVLYTGKTAIEIIGTIDTDGKIVTQGLMSEYDILTYIDVNNNNIIDVGDLVRILSKRANPSFSMTNGV